MFDSREYVTGKPGQGGTSANRGPSGTPRLKLMVRNQLEALVELDSVWRRGQFVPSEGRNVSGAVLNPIAVLLGRK
jgi:hypothetical protein